MLRSSASPLCILRASSAKRGPTYSAFFSMYWRISRSASRNLPATCTSPASGAAAGLASAGAGVSAAGASTAAVRRPLLAIAGAMIAFETLAEPQSGQRTSPRFAWRS